MRTLFFSFFITFIILASCLETCQAVPSVYIPPAQVAYAPYNLVSNRTLSQWCTNTPGTFTQSYALTYAYNHSIRQAAVAQYLFNSPTLTFAGSEVIDRSPTELLADNFGLAQEFEGVLSFKPTCENFIVNFTLDFKWHYTYGDIFLKIFSPFIYTIWDLHTKEFSLTQELSLPDEPFPAGYMAPESIEPAHSIEQAVSGTFTFGDLTKPLEFGIIPFRPRSRLGLGIYI